MEFSKLIGKPVLSAEGEHFGYVLRLYLGENLASLSCLLCADREEEEFSVPACAVRSVGDAIIIGEERLEQPSGVPCPVGKSAFDEHGVFLGGVSALDESGVLTVTGALGEREFPVKLISIGETVVVKSAKKPSKPRSSKGERAESKKPAESSRGKPAETGYRTNLLGRQVQRPIFGLAGAGETVTAEMLRRANDANRLLELAAGVITE